MNDAEHVIIMSRIKFLTSLESFDIAEWWPITGKAHCSICWSSGRQASWRSHGMKLGDAHLRRHPAVTIVRLSVSASGVDKEGAFGNEACSMGTYLGLCAGACFEAGNCPA